MQEFSWPISMNFRGTRPDKVNLTLLIPDLVILVGQVLTIPALDTVPTTLQTLHPLPLAQPSTVTKLRSSAALSSTYSGMLRSLHFMTLIERLVQGGR